MKKEQKTIKENYKLFDPDALELLKSINKQKKALANYNFEEEVEKINKKFKK
jgi:hypothetical protein